MHRVVVTGIGIVSPIGNSVPIFWKNAKEGTNGISKISNLDTSHLPIHIAGECQIDLEQHIDKKSLNKI